MLGLRRSIATIILISSVCSANAVALRGPGAKSCGDWVNQKTDSTISGLFSAYVLGYINGAGFVINDQRIAPTTIDNAALIAWIDKHCRDNPLDNIGDASAALLKELISRARKNSN